MSAQDRSASLAGTTAGCPAERTNTVNDPLTPKAGRTVVENPEYAAFARRILRAYARRIATGDVESLTHMLSLAAEIDIAIQQAVTGLREQGYSWTEIGSRLGVTRQAAQQRWGPSRRRCPDCHGSGLVLDPYNTQAPCDRCSCTGKIPVDWP